MGKANNENKSRKGQQKGKGGRKGRRTKNMILIANERIDILFDFAERERSRGKYDKLDRYVDLARRIGMRYNVRIPANYKHRYCKHCYSYLQPGRTAETKLRKKFMIIHCFNCGKIIRRSLESLRRE